MACFNKTLHAVIGPGLKNFIYDSKHLTPASNFHYDLCVSSTQEQSAVAISKDGSTLVIASDEGHAVVLGLPRYEPLFSDRIHSDGIIDLTITVDGTFVATTARDRAAYIWHASDGQILQSIKPVMPPALRTHLRAIRFCDMQPNLIFTAESNPRKGGWIAAWKRESDSTISQFSPIASLKASTDALTAFAVNRAGTLVAVSSSEGHISVLQWSGSSFSKRWTTEAKTQLFQLPRPPHVLPVTGMQFSSSGNHLLSASADYTVTVWPSKQPTNWRGIFRIALWGLSLMVVLISILVAEDHHLHNVLRQRRDVVAPFLEPQLSNLQGRVRPILKKGHERMQPYVQELQDAVDPHVKRVGEKVSPYITVLDQYRQNWQPVVRQKYSRIRNRIVDTAASGSSMIRMSSKQTSNRNPYSRNVRRGEEDRSTLDSTFSESEGKSGNEISTDKGGDEFDPKTLRNFCDSDLASEGSTDESK